jgi:hypothetical protein
MSNPITSLFLGRGQLSAALRAELEAEGVLHHEDGLRGSITYRHYRRPGEYSSWSKEAIRASFVVTRRRLGVFVRSRPFVNVSFDDPRFRGLDLHVDGANLAIGVDASLFDPQASGDITTKVRCANPPAALALIRTQHARRGDAPA